MRCALPVRACTVGLALRGKRKEEAEEEEKKEKKKKKEEVEGRSRVASCEGRRSIG